MNYHIKRWVGFGLWEKCQFPRCLTKVFPFLSSTGSHRCERRSRICRTSWTTCELDHLFVSFHITRLLCLLTSHLCTSRARQPPWSSRCRSGRDVKSEGDTPTDRPPERSRRKQFNSAWRTFYRQMNLWKIPRAWRRCLLHSTPWKPKSSSWENLSALSRVPPAPARSWCCVTRSTKMVRRSTVTQTPSLIWTNHIW